MQSFVERRPISVASKQLDEFKFLLILNFNLITIFVQLAYLQTKSPLTYLLT